MRVRLPYHIRQTKLIHSTTETAIKAALATLGAFVLILSIPATTAKYPQTTNTSRASTPTAHSSHAFMLRPLLVSSIPLEPTTVST
jgi:hypothetical protein